MLFNNMQCTCEDLVVLLQFSVCATAEVVPFAFELLHFLL